MKRLRKWGLTLIATLSLTTTVLLLTGWGTAVAAQVSSVFVTNTAANPVPVSLPNTTVPVHEQGTANVNVTNGSLSTHEEGGRLILIADGLVEPSLNGTPSNWVDTSDCGRVDVIARWFGGGREALQVSADGVVVDATFNPADGVQNVAPFGNSLNQPVVAPHMRVVFIPEDIGMTVTKAWLYCVP